MFCDFFVYLFELLLIVYIICFDLFGVFNWNCLIITLFAVIRLRFVCILVLYWFDLNCDLFDDLIVMDCLRWFTFVRCYTLVVCLLCVLFVCWTLWYLFDYGLIDFNSVVLILLWVILCCVVLYCCYLCCFIYCFTCLFVYFVFGCLVFVLLLFLLGLISCNLVLLVALCLAAGLICSLCFVLALFDWLWLLV